MKKRSDKWLKKQSKKRCKNDRKAEIVAEKFVKKWMKEMGEMGEEQFEKLIVE